MFSLLKNVNLALAFVLELGVLASLCYFGFVSGPSTFVKIVLGIGLPVVAIVIWALFGAPKSQWQFTGFWFLLLQILFFGSAALALYVSGQRVPGIVFALLFVLNTSLAYAWGQK